MPHSLSLTHTTYSPQHSTHTHEDKERGEKATEGGEGWQPSDRVRNALWGALNKNENRLHTYGRLHTYSSVFNAHIYVH